jgi:hypothetical protein
VPSVDVGGRGIDDTKIDFHYSTTSRMFGLRTFPTNCILWPDSTCSSASGGGTSCKQHKISMLNQFFPKNDRGRRPARAARSQDMLFNKVPRKKDETS